MKIRFGLGRYELRAVAAQLLYDVPVEVHK